MISPQIKDVIAVSATLTIFIYGSWDLFAEIIKTFLPCGIILTGITATAIYLLRVPAPSQDIVDVVIGKEPHTADNGEHYIMKTVAHRGAGLDAPENSLAAFKMCSEKGCDAIEFDVTLTKDEVPIIFHDSTLERMADLNWIVNDHNWEELSTVDISVKHPFKERFAKTNIPTLDQAVIQLLASGQRMFIDIKDNNMKLVKVIHDVFERYPDLYSRAVVTSFFPNIIYFIRRGNPRIVGALAWRPHAFANHSYSYPQGPGDRRATTWYQHCILRFCDFLHECLLWKVTYYLLGLSVILMHKDVVCGKTVLDWRQRGVRVMAWTVNTPVEKQHLARALKITYLTDTLTGEGSTHSFTN